MSKKSAKSKPLKDARAGKEGGAGQKNHKLVGPRTKETGKSSSWESKKTGRFVADRRKAAVSSEPASSGAAKQPPASKRADERPPRPSLLDLIQEMKQGDVQDQERTFETLKHIERTRI